VLLQPSRPQFLFLRAVLPSGEIIRAGKRTIKDVAGYNIAGIIIASEGTLAVITEITLKLIAKPKMAQTAMGIFPTVDDAMNAVIADSDTKRAASNRALELTFHLRNSNKIWGTIRELLQ
jgi:FAD/FMN-containing dehydrogenase